MRPLQEAWPGLKREGFRWFGLLDTRGMAVKAAEGGAVGLRDL